MICLRIRALVFTAAIWAAGCGAAAAQAPAIDATPIECHASVGASTLCLSGRDPDGAWFVIAMPADWNRKLIVHAHGGPRTGDPEARDPLDDLDRFSVMVRQGYAWVG